MAHFSQRPVSFLGCFWGAKILKIEQYFKYIEQFPSDNLTKPKTSLIQNPQHVIQ